MTRVLAAITFSVGPLIGCLVVLACGPELVCQGTKCPPSDALTDVLYHFNETAQCLVDEKLDGSMLVVTALEHPPYYAGSGWTGDAPAPGRIQILYPPLHGDGLEDTALFHEMTHTLLMQEYRDGDANHETPPGPWTPVYTHLAEESQDAYRNR